jgi:hypothetical protein
MSLLKPLVGEDCGASKFKPTNIFDALDSRTCCDRTLRCGPHVSERRPVIRSQHVNGKIKGRGTRRTLKACLHMIIGGTLASGARPAIALKAAPILE